MAVFEFSFVLHQLLLSIALGRTVLECFLLGRFSNEHSFRYGKEVEYVGINIPNIDKDRDYSNVSYRNRQAYFYSPVLILSSCFRLR
ncbi:hypothetical protein ABKN59_003615 [Abortiporus biennis]